MQRTMQHTVPHSDHAPYKDLRNSADVPQADSGGALQSKTLKSKTALQANEVIDAAVMSRQPLNRLIGTSQP